jgi:hypothetical protein
MILALSSHCTALRALAGARVGVGSLASARKPASVAETTVATEIHQSLDVHVDLTTKVAFDLEVLVDALADLLDVGVVEILGALALGNPRNLTDLLRVMRADSVDVLQRNHRMFPTWKVDTCDTSHVLLSLPLLVAGVVTQDPHDTLAAHDLALLTNFSDAWSNLHVSLSLIRPLVGS